MTEIRPQSPWLNSWQWQNHEDRFTAVVFPVTGEKPLGVSKTKALIRALVATKAVHQVKWLNKYLESKNHLVT